jgi:flagellar biosynthesis/type III secretory pathway chaperone
MEEINELTKVLKKQLHLYEKLDELCQQEEKAVIEGNLKKLEETVREEEKIFVQMRVWERLRITLIKILKEKLSLSEKITFSELVKRLEEFSSSSQLEDLQKKIISKIEGINQINQRNISLLEYSIKLIDEYFHRLTGTKSASTYTSRGKTRIKEQTRKLLNRIS